MKRFALYSTLALVVGAVVLRILQHDPGYVLIAIAGKTIEMRFWFAVLLIVVVGSIFVWGVRSIRTFIRAISSGWSLAMATRARRGAKQTQSGLMQFIEGDWLSAQKSLLKAAKDVDEPLIHYLAAARSAYEVGDFQKAESLINKAEKIAPENHLPIAISQARMLFLSERYDPCLKVLHGVKTSAPNHPVILSLLHKVYVAVGDWTSLETLLPQLENKKVLAEADLLVLQKKVYLQLLTASGKQDRLQLLQGEVSNKNAEGAINAVPHTSKVDQVWQRVPKSLKQIPEVVALYCRILLKEKRFNEVEVLLRAVLKKQWDNSLVELYGLTSPSDLKMQYRTAEAWLIQQPNNAVLHLALGRICLRSELWGQAKDYFQSSIHLQPKPEAYAELARLQSALGEYNQSHESCRQGLLQATNGLPELPLP